MFKMWESNQQLKKGVEINELVLEGRSEEINQ